MGATFRFAGSTRATPEPDDADSLFWSPNSKLIGFYSHSKLKKVDPAGGQPEAAMLEQIPGVPPGTAAA